MSKWESGGRVPDESSYAQLYRLAREHGFGKLAAFFYSRIRKPESVAEKARRLATALGSAPEAVYTPGDLKKRR